MSTKCPPIAFLVFAPVTHSATQSRVSPLVYGCVASLNRIFLKRFFKEIHFQGLHHLPAQGPYVLAVKHFSRWDPLVVALITREPHRFMTNANQFSGVQGWLILRLGAFAIDLDRPQLSSLRHTIVLLRQGQRVVIFPEGGIVRDQILRPLKPGLARLVLQAENSPDLQHPIPILPVALHYEPTAQRGATVHVEIGAPLPRPTAAHLNEKERAEKLTEILETTLRSQIETLQKSFPAES
jgi:1-acyl-sn-glycerol-3-phosphate acyltransferase